MVRVAIFLIVPTVLYIGVFFVHLVILTRAGDHNGVLSSAFQASLDVSSETYTSVINLVVYPITDVGQFYHSLLISIKSN